MRDQITAYFISRYSSPIGDELQLAIERVFANPRSIEFSFEEALSQVCWVFDCEWDCGVDEWHVKFCSKTVTE